MSAPLVSVVVRSTARPTLPDALDAVAAQDHGNVEIVVVGASGATHPAPPERAGRIPVRFAASDVPLSRPSAANAGLDAAQGDYVTFLDDDDTMLPGHVSGLVAGLRDGAGVVHSYSRAVFRDGRSERIGRPVALLQLFERSFIHLSAALVARSLVLEGCRFDPQFEILEDWDWFLTLAQRTRFAFLPSETFVWKADAGDSGAGGGQNQDAARFARFRDLVYAKWGPARDALVDRVQPRLQEAAAAAQRGDFASAEAACRGVLAFSQNDPFALNLLAMIERATGRLADARATQALAVDVRPGDPDLVYNLAQLCREAGDMGEARRFAAHALSLAPGVSKYRALAGALG
ncbi:MAG: glycosyltransferase [Burkholderiales bacterium]